MTVSTVSAGAGNRGTIGRMSLYNALGTVAAALSVIMLIKYGFDLSFASTLQLVLDYYERLTAVAFGWAEPYLKVVLEQAGSWVGWDLRLGSHWKHVFVLLWLFFGAGARVRFAKRLWADGAVVAIGGLFFSLATGVAAGAVPLESAQWKGDVLVVAIPIAGIALYDLWLTAWMSLRHRPEGARWLSYAWHIARIFLTRFLLLPVAATIAIGLAFASLAHWLPFVKTIRSPGLAFLFVFLIALTLSHLLVGAIWGSGEPDGREDWWHKYRRNATTYIGRFMLYVILNVACFVLASAGLQVMGL